MFPSESLLSCGLRYKDEGVEGEETRLFGCRVEGEGEGGREEGGDDAVQENVYRVRRGSN